MIVEERIYRIKTGQVPAFLRFVKEQSLPIQQRVLGGLIGYFQTEIGVQSQVVHLWAFDSLDDRARRRSELAALPEWQALLPRLGELIVSAENKILKPANFSPINSLDDVARLQNAKDVDHER